MRSPQESFSIPRILWAYRSPLAWQFCSRALLAKGRIFLQGGSWQAGRQGGQLRWGGGREGQRTAENQTTAGYTGQPKVGAEQATRIISSARQFDIVDSACYLDRSTPVVLVDQPLQRNSPSIMENLDTQFPWTSMRMRHLPPAVALKLSAKSILSPTVMHVPKETKKEGASMWDRERTWLRKWETKQSLIWEPCRDGSCPSGFMLSTLIWR